MRVVWKLHREGWGRDAPARGVIPGHHALYFLATYPGILLFLIASFLPTPQPYRYSLLYAEGKMM